MFFQRLLLGSCLGTLADLRALAMRKPREGVSGRFLTIGWFFKEGLIHPTQIQRKRHRIASGWLPTYNEPGT